MGLSKCYCATSIGDCLKNTRIRKGRQYGMIKIIVNCPRLVKSVLGKSFFSDEGYFIYSLVGL